LEINTLRYPETVYVVIPVFDDWEALGLLLERIRQTVAEPLLSRLAFLIVDDCSTTDFVALPTGVGQSLSVLRLYRNVGHQKAIALGISYLADLPTLAPVLVMDADGEDRPEDIEKLLQAAQTQPGRIVFAHRSKRNEGLLFRLFYGLYKGLFQLLTGKVITFGNFSYVPVQMVKKLAHVSEIWNNYPGGIIRSRLPYMGIPLERGIRLAGASKMNFVSLVLHGFGAISVLIDTTAVRVVLCCILTALASMMGGGIVFGLSFFIETAISNWAIYLLSSFFIVILQTFLISLLLVFMVLNYRTQNHFIPAIQYQQFVEKIDVVYRRSIPTAVF
jgi:polyisoprenyl-phosphate glycosyltransferase